MIGDVGARQRVRIGGQDARDVQRHVPVADDDDAVTAEVHREVGVVGMPVVPGHDLCGSGGSGQAHALDLQAFVVGCPDCVEHRVVVLEQLVVRDVRPDLDVEVEPETVLGGDPVEQPGDPFGGLMIGCDTGADQSVGGRQLLEDVDPHAFLGQQLISGVHRRRPGAHHGHPKRPTGTSIHHRRVQHRRQLRRRGQLALPLRIERRVQLDERQLLGCQFRVGCDGADRTGGNARAAVHTGRRVDVEHLCGGEARLVG